MMDSFEARKNEKKWQKVKKMRKNGTKLNLY